MMLLLRRDAILQTTGLPGARSFLRRLERLAEAPNKEYWGGARQSAAYATFLRCHSRCLDEDASYLLRLFTFRHTKYLHTHTHQV